MFDQRYFQILIFAKQKSLDLFCCHDVFRFYDCATRGFLILRMPDQTVFDFNTSSDLLILTCSMAFPGLKNFQAARNYQAKPRRPNPFCVMTQGITSCALAALVMGRGEVWMVGGEGRQRERGGRTSRS